jgi:hypothetical protein
MSVELEQTQEQTLEQTEPEAPAETTDEATTAELEKPEAEG